MTEEYKPKTHLLAAAMQLSPTQEVQSAFVRFTTDMDREGETEETICLAIASALVDGLRHFNWPEVK